MLRGGLLVFVASWHIAFSYCTERLYQAQKTSNQRNGQPASTDILERGISEKKRENK